jgi:uncharacterized protein
MLRVLDGKIGLKFNREGAENEGNLGRFETGNKIMKSQTIPYFGTMNLILPEYDIELLASKALLFRRERILVVADLHFGKVNTFRRAGLPVPPAAATKTMEILIDLINDVQPSRMIFLGDLFHSHYNEEWEAVGQVIAHFSSCRFELVRGNHDIMSEQQYIRKGIQVVEQEMTGQWILTHEPMERSTIPKGKINLAGHLHPGARLYGKGNQSVMLPCFWFSEKQVIVPAFGSLTGLAAIPPSQNDHVYVVLEDKVMEVKGETTGNRKTAMQ